MPYNGSGTFIRNQDWTADRDAGPPDNTISATKMDNEDDNFKGGFDLALTRDGQAVPTANLPMGGFAHTNVGDATAASQYGVVGQIQNSDYIDAGTSSGTDTITAGLTPALTAYETGQVFSFVAGDTNTGASTFNIDSVGALAVQKLGAALVAGDITAGDVVQVRHDGTQLQMLSPARTPVLTAGSIPATAVATGTSGAAIPLLDGNNTHSGNNTFSGTNEFDALVIWAKGADVVSATALPVLTDGNYFDVTGTNAVTSINTLGIGTVIKLHFDAILTLTNSAADLILPGGANITTAAGDEAEFIEYATGDWRCTNYSKASGQAVVTPTPTPATQLAKAWIRFDGTGTISIDDSFNVTSIVDNGTGNYTINWDTDFATANYSVQISASVAQQRIESMAAGSVQVRLFGTGGASSDAAIVCITAHGDQ